MRKFVVNIALLILSAILADASAAALRQMRGARVDTSRGGIWPVPYSDASTQLDDLDDLLDRFVRANLNTLFIELQHDGTVLWLSDRQPASFEATADGSRRLPYDVAATVIDKAHDRGLQVVAIVSPLDLGTRSNSALYLNNPIAHPLVSEAELLMPGSAEGGRYYLDPSLGATRDYIEELYTELIAGYDIDGLLIDRLDAPGATSSQLTDIIDDISALLDTHRPQTWLAVGQTSLSANEIDGHADYILGTTTPRYIMTQLIGSSESEQAEKMLLGIDAIQLTPFVEALRRVDESPIAGFVVSHPDRLPVMPQLFSYPAHLPEMSWRDGEIPLAPDDFEVNYDSDRQSYILTWSEPTLDKYATPIRYYTVYLARDGQTDLTDPRGEVIHSVYGTEVEIPSAVPGLEFAVTAFDAHYRESLPAVSSAIDEFARAQHPWVFRYYAGTLDIGAPVEITAIDIYNSWGKHLRHISTAPAHEVMTDVDDLPSGVYVVHTHYVDGSVKAYKFIK